MFSCPCSYSIFGNNTKVKQKRRRMHRTRKPRRKLTIEDWVFIEQLLREEISNLSKQIEKLMEVCNKVTEISRECRKRGI